MKKMIKKFWGVAFIVVLLSTLFVGAVPQASAADLGFTWPDNPEGAIPGGLIGGLLTNSTNITSPNTVIYEYAVAGDGTTVYACTSIGAMKSIDAGRKWTRLNTGLLANPALVAVAQDNPLLAVFAARVTNGTTYGDVCATKDGGQTFLPLGGSGYNAMVSTNITDLDVSMSATFMGETVNIIGLSGSIAGPTAEFFYFNLGAAIPTWRAALTDPVLTTRFTGYAGVGEEYFTTIKFTPDFNRDFIAYLIADATATGAINLHVASFNALKCDSLISSWLQYPGAGSPIVAAFATHNHSHLLHAQVVFDPNFWGGEPSQRIAYVNTVSNNASRSSVWRLTDTDTPGAALRATALTGGVILEPVWSISLNAAGTTLVAAAARTSKVWTLTGLTAAPFNFVTINAASKRIGGGPNLGLGAGGAASMPLSGMSGTGLVTDTDNQTIAYAGANVLLSRGAVQGAFAYSVDNGFAFTDISLVNTFITVITDQVVSPDGTKRYVVSNDNNTSGNCTSVFYWDGTYWERVLTRGGINGYVAKASPNNFGILYVGNKANCYIWYTSTSGRTAWATRSSPVAATALTDIEVQDDSTLYVATTVGGTGRVTKLSVTGITWPTAPPYYNAPFPAGVTVQSLTLVAENKLLAGSSDGRVAYTTDGGATALSWTRTAAIGGAAAIYADATDIGPGGTIFATTTVAGQGVYSWSIGTSSVWSWTLDPFLGTTYIPSDVIIDNGVVYCIGSNGTPTFETIFAAARLPAMGFDPFGVWAHVHISANIIFANRPATAVANVVPDSLKVSSGNKFWFIDSQGAGGLDQIITYTNLMATAVTILQSPVDGYLIQVNKETGFAYDVTLIWQNISFFGGTYQWQVAKDAAFTNVITGGTLVAPGMFQPTVLVNIGPNQAGVRWINYQPGETYYWRVRADGPFFSAWTTPFALHVQPAPPPVAELMAPINGGTANSLTPGFSWTAMSGEALYSGIAMTYTFELATDTAFTSGSMVYTTTTTVPGTDLPVTLTDGQQYFWRVRTDTSVTGDWSTVANFTVNLAATSPAVVVTQTNLTLTQTATTAAHEDNVVNPSYIWAIIIIGAVLVIAVIVLIFRTRQTS